MTALGFVILIALVVLGVPLWISILATATYFVFCVIDIDPLLLGTLMFGSVSNSVILIAVPLFILSGQLMSKGGALQPIIRLSHAFLGHIPGGPAYALIAANIVFAAMSGSGLAAVVGFAPIMIPVLTGLGYSLSFAVGLLICSSTLANIIPPAITPIFYGYITKTSVITLWTAGIIPGLMTALFLCITVYIYTRRGHYTRLPAADWRERKQALKEAWPIILMPVFVLAPLYGGVATPTEVSSIAAVYSLLLGTVFYRKLNFRLTLEAFHSTVSIMARVFIIVVVALLLNAIVTYVRLPFQISDWLSGLELNWIWFMAIIAFAFLLMGAFLDPSAIMLVAVPILLPTILSLGIDKVSFGIFNSLAVNIAGITPPYGLVLFAAMGMLNLPFHFVARACLMFYPALILALILIAFIPEISTWLPNLIGR
ncbi:MAG: TRAP transporter large permease [Dehalococcoidia bacterium]|nr:MAG: TRAP transporter large permease [Dehalococcoidia bacterium]UCG84064.1 MAG: TRAP transporter large permease [Dehalococcoidia bacterium]